MRFTAADDEARTFVELDVGPHEAEELAEAEADAERHDEGGLDSVAVELRDQVAGLFGRERASVAVADGDPSRQRGDVAAELPLSLGVAQCAAEHRSADSHGVRREADGAVRADELGRQVALHLRDVARAERAEPIVADRGDEVEADNVGVLLEGARSDGAGEDVGQPTLEECRDAEVFGRELDAVRCCGADDRLHPAELPPPPAIERRRERLPRVRGTRLVVQSLCGLGLVGRGPL
ncbi:MAG: hypothetical protein ABIP17_00920 [Ilumatobacteraceae bacterium]